jgi:hypothetical protein
MPRIQGTTNRQSSFLRAFRNNPAGPPPDQWPSPLILRKWLRRQAFRAALESLRDTHRFQTDFHLAAAASAAAKALTATDTPLTPDALKTVSQLLRLAHQRERHPTELKLQSRSRPGLYTPADRLNLDPWGDAEERWRFPRTKKPKKKPEKPKTPALQSTTG